MYATLYIPNRLSCIFWIINLKFIYNENSTIDEYGQFICTIPFHILHINILSCNTHELVHIRSNTHELEKSIKIQAIVQFGHFIQCVIIQPIQHIFVIFSFDILTHIQLCVHDYGSYT